MKYSSVSVLFHIVWVKFTIQSRSSDVITNLALVNQISITFFLGGFPDFSIINLGIFFSLNDFVVLVSNCSKWSPLHSLSRSIIEFCLVSYLHRAYRLDLLVSCRVYLRGCLKEGGHVSFRVFTITCLFIFQFLFFSFLLDFLTMISIPSRGLSWTLPVMSVRSTDRIIPFDAGMLTDVD